MPKSRNFQKRSWEVEFTKKLSGIGLIDEFGAPAVDAALKDYRIAPVLPKSLHEAFGLVEPDEWRDEE